MENNPTHTLINGKFSPEDAESVLTALFNYKIDYHQRDDFSKHIRFNHDIEHSKKRVQELTETKEIIKQLIADSKSNNLNLVIKGEITIQFEKQ
jgi:hypothetical protein